MTTAFSFEQQSVLDGSLLGDGHLTNPQYGNSAFQKTQTSRRREYLDWTHEVLGEYSSSVNDYDNWAKGKKYRKSQLLSSALPIFTDMRNRWYADNTKVVPRDLSLNPMSVAIWFFDDGSNYLKKRQCRFATNSFSVEDCEFLCRQLKQLRIESYITSAGQVQVRTESYKTLIDIISPYMKWSFFKHKIQYRDSELKFTTSEEATEMSRLYSDGWTQKQIADDFGKSVSCVSNILRGNRKVSVNDKQPLTLKNTSGIKGVSWDKSRSKWKASKRVGGRTVNFGRFDTKEEAESALLDNFA